MHKLIKRRKTQKGKNEPEDAWRSGEGVPGEAGTAGQPGEEQASTGRAHSPSSSEH